MGYTPDVEPRLVRQPKDKHMNKNILVAVPFSLMAIAALVLSSRFPVTAESAIGYVSVFALLAFVALEYRITWKGLFGRS
jgi:hypothetical membrane protein